MRILTKLAGDLHGEIQLKQGESILLLGILCPLPTKARRIHLLKVRLFKLVHHWEGPERFQNFLWKINHETMLINVRRKHFGISENDSCQLC